MTDEVRDLLVRIDCWHTLLGASLVDFLDEGFDPDRYYTPMECDIRALAEEVGLSYYQDVFKASSMLVGK